MDEFGYLVIDSILHLFSQNHSTHANIKPFSQNKATVDMGKTNTCKESVV